VLELLEMPTRLEIREFTGADFRSLAEVEEPVCLSMFVSQGGGEQAALAHHDLPLKDLVRQADDALRAGNVPSAEIHDWLAPLEALLSMDRPSGTEQSFAILRTRSGLHAFIVPLRVSSRVVVGGRFFLKPLIPCLTRTRAYYVLAISDNASRLFRCREAESRELHSPKLPGSLEETLASRDFSPRLQGHTSRASARKVITYHGHSAPVEEIHENRRMYCRQLDAAVRDLLGQSSEPLVLACVKELFAEFQTIHTYPHVVSEPIRGNPDRLSQSELHEAAQRIIDSETEKQIARAVAEYTVQNTDRASTNAEAIFEAALRGCVRTIFVADDAEMWGTLDQVTGATRLAIGSQSPERDEFLNWIAIQTVIHGGIAYALPLASMPSRKPVAALFRY
jgi:hypothetical protein